MIHAQHVCSCVCLHQMCTVCDWLLYTWQLGRAWTVRVYGCRRTTKWVVVVYFVHTSMHVWTLFGGLNDTVLCTCLFTSCFCPCHPPALEQLMMRICNALFQTAHKKTHIQRVVCWDVYAILLDWSSIQHADYLVANGCLDVDITFILSAWNKRLCE